MDRYTSNKNKEGYTDLTACKGIKRADKGNPVKPKTTEADEQKALIQWAKFQEKKYSELKMLMHVPNEGKRSPRYGAELKRLGLQAGFPDLALFVPRNGKAALFIEMKVGRNKCTDNQKKWIRNLLEQGYEVKVCYSCEEAIQVIKKYLNI
ncbi:VRR-NUC domain-containing protein [Intestinibacter bartlettii]|uniref:VRR-NUC domain-containing protein n=1 Tax=Intestinibacter bartlettii TaxID=261299 RepID=UPI0008210DF1|nr:VRR-NUC domain-containing protein [Intestinibacter bartlettii]SCI52166.1 VRR-NUC domain [uncultured Clostridium sp.]